MKHSHSEQLKNCKIELTYIEKTIKKEPLDNRVPYLTMYALIKACGTIECVFKSIVVDYFKKSSISQIHTYLDKTVSDSSRSPNYNNMCQMLKNFDDQWSNNFKDNVENHPEKNKLKSSIDSLVSNRHQFAHGKNPTVTFGDINTYFMDAVELLKIFDKSIK